VVRIGKFLKLLFRDNIYIYDLKSSIIQIIVIILFGFACTFLWILGMKTVGLGGLMIGILAAIGYYVWARTRK
jgi:hypothetical protein